MIQSIDNINKPVYSAVNIHITKPEVNAKSSNQTSVTNDNGVYNSVKIDIDNPTVNTEPKAIYDYPEAKEIVTYDKTGINNIDLPEKLPVKAEYYEETVVIPEEIDETKESEKKAEVPAPNYTDVEAEKNLAAQNTDKEVSFHAGEKKNNIKRPEIVPSEEIKPSIDISKTISNLSSKDFDIQAKQIEEIARASLKNPENGKNYIVKDIFSALINVTKKDSTQLAGPTEAQTEARKKIITNFIAAEIAKRQNKEVKIPYQLTKEDVANAEKLSPMEQAERNKEYALYTIAILAKIYTDEVQKLTGNVVPFTDVPGISAMVDALRFNPNAGVKLAALDSLKHIARPEYKDEILTIFSIVQNDKNPQVAKSAAMSIEALKANS